MKCVLAGKHVVREVFTMKLPIPDEIRKMAENARKTQAPRSRRRQVPATPLLLQAPPDGLQALPPIDSVIQGPPHGLPAAPRQRLRRPVRPSIAPVAVLQGSVPAI
jgi:hypothetical protein